MENQQSAQFMIAKNLQELVTHFLPAGAKENQVQKLVQYSMRILGSKISSINQTSDPIHLKQLLLQKISSKQKPNNARSSLNQETLRFEELLTKFRRNRVLQRNHEMLHLLLQLSGEGNHAGIEPADKILDSVYNNKIMNKVDYTAQNKKKEKTDVEMKDVSQSQKSLSTKQKQMEYLKNQRFNSPSGEVNEDVIVRDLLFVFQGIQGQHMTYSLLEDAFILAPNLNISPSTKKIINELSELGWLFKKVNDWLTRNIEMSMHCNQVTQSLCFAAQAELTEYYRLLAILESQRTKYTLEDPANYLNLKKLYLWIQEPLERMKWLALIIDSVQNLKGGAVCSAINSYVLNGSPSTKTFISRILKEVSAPILTMIKQWMIEGEINDPFGEFFVEINPNVGDDKLWIEKYKLNYIMIPTFLSNQLAHKILLTGKAVNFIRRCCNEQDWILDVSLQMPFEAHNLVGSASETFHHLKNWVDHAYIVTNKQLLKILFQKYKFEGHCNSIRKYLLMGQGDFMQYLMDLLADELNNPASQIYKHTLQGYLETAVRSSNAQYHDSEFLNRLDIKLLDSSPGDKGWEIFLLEYKLNDLAPLCTVFSEDIMMNYLKIFNFLWRLKRVEHALSSSWRINKAHAQKFAKIKGMRDKFHKFNLYHHEMVHFVSNIHNYIMVEVLESSWKIFQDEVKSAQDLDQVIDVQKKFVYSILDKALLSEKTNKIYLVLQRLLNQVYNFTFIKEKYFYPSALDEYDRIVGLEQSNPDQIMQEDLKPQISRQSIEQMEKLYADFLNVFTDFKNILLQQNQTNLKYLVCRLDFNEYYQRLESKQAYEKQNRKKPGNAGDDLDLDSEDYGDEDEEEDDGEEDDYDEEDYEGEQPDKQLMMGRNVSQFGPDNSMGGMVGQSNIGNAGAGFGNNKFY